MRARDAAQAEITLSTAEAMRVAYHELHALRHERASNE